MAETVLKGAKMDSNLIVWWYTPSAIAVIAGLGLLFAGISNGLRDYPRSPENSILHSIRYLQQNKKVALLVLVFGAVLVCLGFVGMIISLIKLGPGFFFG